MEPQSSRQIKIYSKHRSEKEVPELRSIGVWLESCGSGIGDMVEIIVKDRELIIKPQSHGN